MKIADFHVNIAGFHFKTKDHLQGIVTPMFYKHYLFRRAISIDTVILETRLKFVVIFVVEKNPIIYHF